MEKIKNEEIWYAILGTRCGICSVHPSRAEAKEEHTLQKYTKKNRIVKCIVSY